MATPSDPSPDLVRIERVIPLPTPGSVAVCFGTADKLALFHTDEATGAAIDQKYLHVEEPRPRTHDLFISTLQCFGASLSCVVIERLEDGIFYTNLVMTAENETLATRKHVEVDCRPSDAFALAMRAEAPMFIRRALWEELEDVEPMLKAMKVPGEGND